MPKVKYLLFKSIVLTKYYKLIVVDYPDFCYLYYPPKVSCKIVCEIKRG